jgi:hypothetical protein
LIPSRFCWQCGIFTFPVLKVYSSGS